MNGTRSFDEDLPLRSRMKTSSVRFFFIITVSCFLSTEKRLHAKKLLQASTTGRSLFIS